MHKQITVGRLAKAYIHQLCADTKCRLDVVLRAIAEKDRLRERFKGIHFDDDDDDDDD